ncbi:MAG: UDP-N-acetyl glucosamine 2-epimerase, partial [bacterium]|nr:UDP-N-acetyl glucosamine 2-epimerase [bacterium]
MRKVMSIVGARPQFIKSAIVSLKLKEKGITELLLHTGQHYDHNMSDIFFKELGMSEPDWHL